MNRVISALGVAAGIIGAVVANIGALGLPDNVRATVTAVGGLLVAIIVALEHPTTKAVAAKPSPAPRQASPIVSTVPGGPIDLPATPAPPTQAQSLP